MAYKTETWWINPDGVRTQDFTKDGVYEEDGALLSTEPILVTFTKGSGADPIGATVKAGVRLRSADAPEDVDGATLVLPTLDGAQASLPVTFLPKGKVCLTVSGYVAPFRAARVQ